MDGHIARMAETAYKILDGRPWRRWGDSIRTDLREIRWKGADWIHLA